MFKRKNKLVKTINVANLSRGSIVHIQLGMEMGDGLEPWIPGPEQLVETRDEFRKVVPPDVEVVVTHVGVNIKDVLSP
jgi:hypothetical protein